MTVKQRQQLVEALVRGGYNLIDAQNASVGVRADELFREYCGGNAVDDFFKRYNMRYVDYDKKWGCQCVDLIRFYLTQVHGLDAYALPGVDYAKNFYNVYSKSATAKKHFDWIPNTRYAVPNKGAVVVWRGWELGITGVGGHVGLFDSGNDLRMVIFSQNYPTGSPCSFRTFGYRGVLGWFERKK